MKRLIVCLLILFFANALKAATPVYIPDPNLKAAIEDELGVPNPTATDMLELTYLRADSNGISDLTGLETALNLKRLRANLNLITILSPLFSLTKLEYLNLMDNNITNISSLQQLTKLKYLYLDRNDNISDINAISDMNNLAELGLVDVNLTTITPLADVNQIKYLYLGNHYNHIQDINSLRGYLKLVRLNLTYNNPLSIASRCDYLQEIAENNPTASITPNPANDVNTFSTDWIDLRIFVNWWLSQVCGTANGYCSCADLDDNGKVGFSDYAIFAEMWMSI